jgi:undecaprenyl diphosphate synthase
MLTLYAFSVENWERPAGEVSLLMRLLKSYLVRERKSLMKDGIRLRAIGDLQKIPSAARAELEESIRVTSENQGITLQLALSYGGRDEIVRACNRLLAQAREDALPITAEKFSSALDTQNQKDPDLIIRTSGELRISNFLLWQAAYAEFVVSSKRWPDFDEEEFDRMLEEYSKRERRFGRVGEETLTSIKGPHSLLSKRRLNEA